MPDVASLEVIKINIDSIQADRSECKEYNKQEVQTDADNYTNMWRSATNNMLIFKGSRTHQLIQLTILLLLATQMQTKENAAR